MVFLISYLSRLKNGFRLLMSQSVITTFSFSFVWLYFYQLGYELQDLVLISLLCAGTSVMILPFIRVFHLRRHLISAFLVFSLISLLLALKIPFLPYVYGLLLGVQIVLFWVPLNYLFFLNSSNHTNAVDSSFYFTTPMLIVIVMPPLGAFFLHAYGYFWIYLLSAVLFLFPIFLARKLPAVREPAPFWESYLKFKGLRSVTFCEGALHFFTSTILPVFTLLYFATELKVGAFTAYLGLVGFLVGLVLSHLSDKSQQRKKYLYFLFALLSACIFSLAFVKTSWQWILAVGVYVLIVTVSMPLRLAISLDVRKSDMGFWKMRELVLNLGRIFGLSLSWVFFSLKWYGAVFALYALIALAYPFLVRKKMKQIK